MSLNLFVSVFGDFLSFRINLSFYRIRVNLTEKLQEERNYFVTISEIFHKININYIGETKVSTKELKKECYFYLIKI